MFDPTRTSVAEQVIAVAGPLLLTSRPAAVPAFERDRVIDLETDALPSGFRALLLAAYEERIPAAQELGVENCPMDGSEERSVRLHFLLYGQAEEGKTATQATDLMACWIVDRLCGEIGSASPFFGLADSINPGARTSRLAKASAALCVTAFEIIVSTSYLTNDLTRRG